MSSLPHLARRAYGNALRNARNFSKSSGARAEARNPDVHPVYYKVKETQKMYQVDNGLCVRPIEKGFRHDFLLILLPFQIHERHSYGKSLFYFTCVSIAGCSVYTFSWIFGKMFPKKPE